MFFYNNNKYKGYIQKEERDSFILYQIKSIWNQMKIRMNSFWTLFNVFCNSAWYSNRWTINCKNVILPWLQICKESSKMVSNEWECNWIKYTHGKRKWMNVSRDCSTIISIIITIKDDKEATDYKSHSYVQMKLLFSVCSK